MAKRLLGSVSFVIYGSAIVDHARDIVLSGEWLKGMQSLREAVDGFTLDHAMSVLSGEMTLEGDSNTGLSLVKDEHSQEYKKTMREVYIDDHFYQNGELYRFVRKVDYYDIRSMIDSFLMRADVSAEDQLSNVAKHYSDLRDEKVFRYHSELFIIAKKENPNVLPMWYKRSDFHEGYFRFVEKYLGIPMPKKVEPSYIKSVTIESEEKKAERKQYVNKLVRDGNNSYMEGVVEEYKESSLEEFSKKLSERVMQSCQERNVTWEKIDLCIDGNSISVNVPVEIMMGYLSRDPKHWSPICDSGLKMYNDSPWHSDLWLAMGNELSADAYDHDLLNTQFFYEAIEEFRARKLNDLGEFTLLNDTKLKKFEGRIVFEDSKNITDRDILVLPNAGLKYEKIACKAGMVISETGGQLSHLAIVGKEEMFPVIVMKNALVKLRNKYSALVDFEKRTILSSF